MLFVGIHARLLLDSIHFMFGGCRQSLEMQNVGRVHCSSVILLVLLWSRRSVVLGVHLLALQECTLWCALGSVNMR